MTREEAIETLEEMIKLGDLYEVDIEACEIAIEALKQEPTIEAYKQVCKERDIAIEQLHELGYDWGQKIEPCREAIESMNRWNDYVNGKDVEPMTIAEQCSDVISRQAAIDVVSGIDRHFVKYIKDLPSVQPIRPRGQWIDKWDNSYWYLTCSVCGEAEERNSKYCPNCGAQMESEVES